MAKTTRARTHLSTQSRASRGYWKKVAEGHLSKNHAKPRRQEQESIAVHKAIPARAIEKRWPKATFYRRPCKAETTRVLSSWPCTAFQRWPSANFCNILCWLNFVYCGGFLLLSSWPCVFFWKVAFGHLLSITPAGSALCTVVGSWSFFFSYVQIP